MNRYISILSTRVLKMSVMREALLAGLAIMDYDFVRVSYKQQLEPLNGTLVFTCQQAVKTFAEHTGKTNSFSQPVRAYCLQGETQTALENIPGIEIISAEKDALSLADKIVADKYTHELSFICGHYRPDELPGLLRQHKINVREIKVYETHYAGKPVIHPYRAVLFFSPAAADSFFQTNILFEGIPCFCVGNSTVAAVKGYTDNRVIEATEQTEEGMLKSMKEFFRNKIQTI